MYAELIEPSSSGIDPELFCFFGGTPKDNANCIPSGSTPTKPGDCLGWGGTPC